MLAAQYLTLLFVGGISASSMRGFLHDMRKVRLQHMCASIKNATALLAAEEAGELYRWACATSKHPAA